MAEFHFFTGENTYALESELRRWKHAFAAKHGPENLEVLEGKDLRLSDLLDIFGTMPFIAEKRLVVIRGLPKIDREDLRTAVENMHPQVVAVVAEAVPDKRLGMTKEILTLARVKQFDTLGPGELSEWARRLAASAGATIGGEALRALVDIAGSDQWTLESEILKLAAYAKGEILPTHVELLSVPSGEQVVWKLTDLIGNRKIGEALHFLEKRLERGEDPYGLWVILLNMVKNLTLVWAGLQSGLRDDRSIASAFKLHFLSVRGLLPLARALSAEKLEELVRAVSDADLALKTGGYHYTAERQGEITALAERTIMRCA